MNNTKTKLKVSINPNLSEIMLNVNGLNTTSKRHKLAEWIKNVLAIYCL